MSNNSNKQTDLEVKRSLKTGWVGPNGVNVPTVQDLIDALNKIEDKSIPVSVTDYNSDLGGSIFGMILHEINDVEEAYEEGGMVESQLELKVENIWI